MFDTFVTVAAWLAVVAIAVSAVLFGQEARTPTRAPRVPSDPRTARNRRIGTALSISGPVAVVLLALAVAITTEAWLIAAAVAFAAVGIVSLAGLALAPH
ncbi:MAG: hypothetical protein M3381_09740 [Actinomycetota bacterium]|nr:hypothetical protein [Actinomycetota bacterium]